MYCLNISNRCPGSMSVFCKGTAEFVFQYIKKSRKTKERADDLKVKWIWLSCWRKTIITVVLLAAWNHLTQIIITIIMFCVTHLKSSLLTPSPLHYWRCNLHTLIKNPSSSCMIIVDLSSFYTIFKTKFWRSSQTILYERVLRWKLWFVKVSFLVCTIVRSCFSSME